MILFVWITLIAMSEALATNRPQILEIKNNAGIFFEEECKLKILNQPIQIYTLFNLDIQDELLHFYLKKSPNASSLIYANNRYRAIMKDTKMQINDVFSAMVNETEIQFNEDPRAIYFPNQLELQLKNIWGETISTTNITATETEKLALIFEKIAEVIEITRKFEQPLEFFKTIDWIGIRNRLNRFFKEEIIPVEKCKFRINMEIQKLNNKTLAFILKVPTVLHEEYTAYRLHRMPNFLDIGAKTIAKRITYHNDFLATNQQGDRSFFLSETEIQNSQDCNSEDLYLKRAPIINTKSSCEEELLKLNTMNCPTETSLGNEPVIERTRTGIVFSVPKEEKVKVKCANYNQIKYLKGHGLVKLPSSCEIKIRDKVYKGTDNSTPRLVTPQGNLEFGDIT